MGEAECLMPLPREKMTFGDTSYTKPEYQPLCKPHTRTKMTLDFQAVKCQV